MWLIKMFETKVVLYFIIPILLLKLSFFQNSKLNFLDYKPHWVSRTCTEAMVPNWIWYLCGT